MTISTLKNAYENLLSGNVRMPRTADEKVLFQAMMVASMVTGMVTFNEFLHNGSAFLATLSATLFIYPETFCIAFTVRTLIGNPITGRIIGGIIAPRFSGVAKGALISCTNILVMATIMCGVGTFLAGQTDAFPVAYVTALPATWAAAFLLNFLAIGPFVKAIFGRIMKARDKRAEMSSTVTAAEISR